MENKKINWGIIGCGDVTEVKSGPAFQKVKNSCLIGVMRRQEAKVIDFAKRHGVAYWTTNATELIENKEVNAVYVATPPSSHLKYALQAIKAGKHVYLEKPMVLNTHEAEVLLSAVKKNIAKVTVAHYRRELPVFKKVKTLLDSNSIGKVASVKIVIKQKDNTSLIAKTEDNWRLNQEISGGGYFHDIAPHQIDLMCHYFGEVEIIKKGFQDVAQYSKQNVAGEMIFKNGVKFTGLWNFNASEDMDSCIIHGEKGRIVFSFYNDTISLSVCGKTEIYKYDTPEHVQQPMIDKTVHYFLSNSLNPCSVCEAAVVTQIMDVFCGIK
ncbi:Gfo/Idh/MocA family protein [Algibacter lectus]|uniref:Putative dehydrogenase n=1 Tax=Algibacter lectus TaxID=221126 RepID=A0A4R8ME48_9FLAO|nr:Gfo/Idh/MocA family oxidoreductase [Algibacter lectus]MWW23159.1 gfo/Idh/MocA family oxidoreductase [Algibacter lectus]TDY64163.1 putative dehydrogenase [Algibacter lectus]